MGGSVNDSFHAVVGWHGIDIGATGINAVPIGGAIVVMLFAMFILAKR